jgi:maleylacetoacetate isomerase
LALALKGAPYRYEAVNLLQGEQAGEANAARNPQKFVPTLELPDGTLLTQSLAILEWLEETHPTPALLPADALGRARVRAICAAIVSDIHPLANLRVLGALEQAGLAVEARKAWVQRWMRDGLAAVERLLAAAPPGPYAWGAEPGWVDVHLTPLLYSAGRFGVEAQAYPRIAASAAHAAQLPAFQAAHPDRQPDAGA